MRSSFPTPKPIKALWTYILKVVQHVFTIIVNVLYNNKGQYTSFIDKSGIRAYTHRGHYYNFRYHGDFKKVPICTTDNDQFKKDNIIRCIQMCRWVYYAHLAEYSPYFEKYMKHDHIFDIPYSTFGLEGVHVHKTNNIFYSVCDIPRDGDNDQRDGCNSTRDRIGFMTFCGTQFIDIEAWHMNFNFHLKPIHHESKALYHAGYFDKMFSLSSDGNTLYDVLLESVNQYNEIYICGHSMGSAIALLFALFLKLQNKNKKIHVLLCALPRVCNKHFVTKLRKNDIDVHLYMHPFDGVRALPFTSLIEVNKEKEYTYPCEVTNILDNKKLCKPTRISRYHWLMIVLFGAYYHNVDRYNKSILPLLME